MIPDKISIEKIFTRHGPRYELTIWCEGKQRLFGQYESFNEALEAVINWTNGVVIV